MQASVMRIDEFISDKRTLVIPVYQRDYDWLKANCERLFDDVELIARDGKEHFTGTFVYQYKPAAGKIFRHVQELYFSSAKKFFGKPSLSARASTLSRTTKIFKRLS